jgi:hypothetical protein
MSVLACADNRARCAEASALHHKWLKARRQNISRRKADFPVFMLTGNLARSSKKHVWFGDKCTPPHKPQSRKDSAPKRPISAPIARAISAPIGSLSSHSTSPCHCKRHKACGLNRLWILTVRAFGLGLFVRLVWSVLTRSGTEQGAVCEKSRMHITSRPGVDDGESFQGLDGSE